jgi:hypothetical protein
MIAKKQIDKTVNILQVQFVLMIIHSFQLLFIDCNYPRAFVWWIGLHAVMFYFLFADFYKQAYRKKQANKVRAGILYYKLMLLCCLCVCFTVLFHKQQYTPFPVSALVGIATCIG